MFEALQYSFFQRALLAAVLASIACGIVGTFVVVKKISSISGGVSHAALGGVGLGYFFGFAPMLGATFVSVLSAIFIGKAHLRDDQSLDTLISVVWSLGMALGILLISLTPGFAPDLGAYLFGNILLAPMSYIIAVAVLDLLILLTVVIYYRQLQAVVFDQEFAKIRGINVERHFLTLLILMALTVVVLIKVVGAVLLIALLTIPAVIARESSENLKGMMILSTAAGMLCSILGLFLSFWLSNQYSVNAPSGPIIVLLAVIGLALAKMRGRG